jgi:hypothetical protein
LYPSKTRFDRCTHAHFLFAAINTLGISYARHREARSIWRRGVTVKQFFFWAPMQNSADKINARLARLLQSHSTPKMPRNCQGMPISLSNWQSASQHRAG